MKQLNLELRSPHTEMFDRPLFFVKISVTGTFVQVCDRKWKKFQLYRCCQIFILLTSDWLVDPFWNFRWFFEWLILIPPQFLPWIKPPLGLHIPPTFENHWTRLDCLWRHLVRVYLAYPQESAHSAWITRGRNLFTWEKCLRIVEVDFKTSACSC